jgi:hypothetical protein
MAPAGENECVVSAAGASDTFDAEIAIAGLLADANRASIELPRMLTAEQRKHAKKIVEQHPNLKCESFGLGEDRQMHVFKRATGGRSPDCSPGSVTVKNTFIDDWIQPDGSMVDQRTVQSMPHNMFAQHLSAEMSGHAASDTSLLPPTHEGTASDASLLPPTPEGTASAGSYSAPATHMKFALGAKVVIDGLVKAPSFNGAVGVIQAFDEDAQRYDVLLEFATANGQRWAKIKADNLRLAMPSGTISFGCFDDK